MSRGECVSTRRRHCSVSHLLRRVPSITIEDSTESRFVLMITLAPTNSAWTGLHCSNGFSGPGTFHQDSVEDGAPQVKTCHGFALVSPKARNPFTPLRRTVIPE